MTDGEISQRELARQLGIDEKALRKWLKKPGVPDAQDVEAWKKFAKENDIGRSIATPAIAELRAEKIAVETRLLKLKEKQAKAELVDVAEVRSYLATLAAKFDQLLTQKLEVELPARIVGKEIVDVRAECRALHDEIRESNNAGISQWKPSA